MSATWSRHVVFDRELPLSETAAGGAEPHTLTTAQSGMRAGLSRTTSRRPLEASAPCASCRMARANP